MDKLNLYNTQPSANNIIIITFFKYNKNRGAKQVHDRICHCVDAGSVVPEKARVH